MTVAATELAHDNGQLRLNLEEGLPLPQFKGVVRGVCIKNDTIYAEVKADTGGPSICSNQITSCDSFYSVTSKDEDFAKILRQKNKTYLSLLEKTEKNDNVMNFSEMAAALGIDAKFLWHILPTQGQDQKNHYTVKELELGRNFIKAFAAAVHLGPETLSDDHIILDDNRIFNTKTKEVKKEDLSFPYLEGGFLKIPGSDPAFQISSVGAFLRNDDTIISVDTEGVVSEVSISHPSKTAATELGKINFPGFQDQKITGFSGFKKGKVFFVTAKSQNEELLVAVNGETFESLGEVKGIKGPISCDQVGNVYFVDANNDLRVVSSNIPALSGKKIVPRTDEKLSSLRDASNALEGLELPAEAQNDDTPQISEADKELHNIREKLHEKIGPEIDKCRNLDDIQKLERRIMTLKQRPAFIKVPSAFEPSDEQIANLKEQFAYPQFIKQLDQLDRLLDAKNPDLTKARAALFSIIENRSKIVFLDNDHRLEIAERIKGVSTAMEGLSGKADQQAVKFAEKSTLGLSQELSTCATQDEVMAVVMEGSGKSIKETISQVSDNKIRAELNEKLQKVVDDRIVEISKILEAAKLKEAEAQLKVRQEYNSLIERFRNALAAVTDKASLQDQTNSPVARAIKKQIELLPAEDKENAAQVLGRMISERAKTVDFSKKVYDLTQKTGYVKFGNIEFPKAGNYEVLCHSEFKPLQNKPGFLELVWTDTRGKQYKPEIPPVGANANDQEKNGYINSTKDEANKYFQSLALRPPKILSHWIINKHYEDYLQELCELLKFQRELQRGLTIIEGDAGTAKSAIVQMFCALTNRPMHTFACNGQTEKEDLTYIYQYDPAKGTYRLDSGFIEALQTPNAVVLLEEINSLPTPVAKMLNTLFDFKRELYLPDGRIIKADPSVLIIGLQNPQSYAGVNKLSKEFLSRAIVMKMDYCKEKESSTYLPYEAEMYAKYRPCLADLNQQEFYALWNRVINTVPSDDGKKLTTPQREAEIKGLQRLISVANSARSAYRAYQNEESNESFEFIFSYREAEVIAHLWDGTSRIENMIARIVLPKITEAVERKAMEAMIKSTPVKVPKAA
jgi:hypothetical protein